MSRMNHEYFARKLVSVYDYFSMPNFDLEHYSKKVMQAFLFMGSDTPENRACFELIHYSKATPDSSYYVLYGFKLRDKPIFVQEALSIVKTLSMPETMQNCYPELTQAEWSAAISMAIEVIQAFSLREVPNRDSGWNVGSEYFARKLWSLYDNFDYPDFDVVKFSHRIMNAFMEFNWSNRDKEQCFQLIEYGKAQNPFPERMDYGFKIKGKPILVDDILWELESVPIPNEVGAKFPDLTSNEWEALLRMATMIVIAFSPSANS